MKYVYYLLTIVATILFTGCGTENKPPEQKNADKDKLQALDEHFKEKHDAQKKEAVDFAKQHHIPLRKELPDGSIIELQKIENGIPMYYGTNPNKNNHSEISTKQEGVTNESN